MDGDSATVDHPPVVEVDRLPVDWDLVDRVEERRPDRFLVRRRRLAPQHDVETDLELGERRQRGGSAQHESPVALRPDRAQSQRPVEQRSVAPHRRARTDGGGITKVDGDFDARAGGVGRRRDAREVVPADDRRGDA